MARQKSRARSDTKRKSRQKRFVWGYPLVIFLLLCVGVFLVAWTWRAVADDIIVTAKVPGPSVTAPAVITTPANGAHFMRVPVTIRGNCPTNAAYIEIFRNGLMSGSAICSGSTFQMSIDLFSGRNDLVAHVFNVTDDEGPVSSTVTIYYDKPQPTGHSTINPTTNPLLLRTDFLYKGYYIGQKVEWSLAINGGRLPYAISIDWGDGHNDVISRSSEGEFTIKHIYSHIGGYHNSYQITVKASDVAFDSAYLQFFVIVNQRNDSGLAGNIYSKTPPSLGNHWLWLAWPAYAFVLIMFFSFWLGEREELIILRKRRQLKH
jgi:hypothetical protein